MHPHNVGALGKPNLFLGMHCVQHSCRSHPNCAAPRVSGLALEVCATIGVYTRTISRRFTVSAIERDSCAVERGNPVNPYTATAVPLTLLAMVSPVLADEQLVLIVSAASKIEQLDSPVFRKVFLGLTVTHNGERLRPVLNEADARVKVVFLQNVVSMSDITGYRRLLRLALQQCQTQPVAYEDIASLIKDVPTDPIAVSYAWTKDVEHNVDVKIIGVLWQD